MFKKILCLSIGVVLHSQAGLAYESCADILSERPYIIPDEPYIITPNEPSDFAMDAFLKQVGEDPMRGFDPDDTGLSEETLRQHGVAWGTIIVDDASSESIQPRKYTEGDLQELRNELGFEEVASTSSQDAFSVFAFKNENTLLISNQIFTNAQEANDFCESVNFRGLSFKLLDHELAYNLVMNDLPFSQLIDTAYVNTPLIKERDSLLTGVLFWAREEGYRTDNTVLAITNGNGEGAYIYESLSDLNERLDNASLKNVGLHAVCVEKGT